MTSDLEAFESGYEETTNDLDRESIGEERAMQHLLSELGLGMTGNSVREDFYTLYGLVRAFVDYYELDEGVLR